MSTEKLGVAVSVAACISIGDDGKSHAVCSRDLLPQEEQFRAKLNFGFCEITVAPS